MLFTQYNSPNLPRFYQEAVTLNDLVNIKDGPHVVILTNKGTLDVLKAEFLIQGQDISKLIILDNGLTELLVPDGARNQGTAYLDGPYFIEIPVGQCE